jgi:2-dehydropantoate 2-reductase
MEMRELSFLVVGAGAIGGITAALLKKNGYNTGIICKYPDYASLISEEGLAVSGYCGSFQVKLPAWATAVEAGMKADIILLATKATDMTEAVKSLLPLLKKDGYIVSLQNGICEEAIASVAGKERVIGCVTGWGATMTSQGKLTMTSGGEFILGYPDAPADDFLSSLARVLSCVVPVSVSNNIMGHLYSKLVINSCITSLGAVCGLYLGTMLSKPKMRRIFIAIIKEAMNVADAMGLKVEIYGGKLDLSRIQRAGGFFPLLRCHLILLVIGFRYRRLKSSSLQSLERGKPTEIDFLNGYIVQNGRRLGIPVTVNEKIVDVIHNIEQGKERTGMHNFSDQFFNRFD